MSSAFSSSIERKPILTPEELEEFQGYDFPFENLALQGGGSKGMAYVGTLRVLEELGMIQKIKRFAGSSIGGLFAASMALGVNSYEIHEAIAFDVSTLFNDAKMGYIGAGINLYRKMGANPAHRLRKWMSDRCNEKFGQPELTFDQLYKATGKELCVTAVSLNRMETEFLHVKTTPDMPISLAIRATVSIPVIMMPVKYKVMSKEDDVLVDGGLLHNYPIDCFDGWYLSLEQENSFLERFAGSWEDRFAGTNEKTLGAVVNAYNDADVLKTCLAERARKYHKPGDEASVPDTSRSRKRIKNTEDNKKMVDTYRTAITKFANLLKSVDVDNDGMISREEFKTSICQNGMFTKEDAKLLFGSDSENPDAIFDAIDTNGNGEIEFCELLGFAEKKGVDLMESQRGFERLPNIGNITGLFGALIETLLVNANRSTIKKDDLDRTVGINTGYLGSFDFSMEPEGREYIIQCGKLGMVYFLREYIQKHNLKKPPPSETIVTADPIELEDITTMGEL